MTCEGLPKNTETAKNYIKLAKKILTELKNE